MWIHVLVTFLTVSEVILPEAVLLARGDAGQFFPSTADCTLITYNTEELGGDAKCPKVLVQES